VEANEMETRRRHQGRQRVWLPGSNLYL
jgi:hypothetical protein